MQKYFSFSKLKSLATTININSSIIKVLSPIIAVGLITSCVPRPKSSPDFNETATFYIKDDSSRLQVTLTNKINGLGLNTSRFLGFTVCVLDKVHSRPVIDKTFDIIREYDNKTFEAKTNESGCMSWTEELELFNPLAIEGYIHITRQITARTPHRGTIAFERAYNPSSKLGEGQTAVINPNIVRVGNLIEEKDLNKLFAIKRHLNVPDGRIKTSFSKNLPNGRRTVSIEANLNVVALVETESHIVQPIKLNQGKFLVDFYWYAKKPNGKKVDRYLLHRQDGISAEILKGSLPLSVDIDLNATPDKDAQLMMGIRLTPVDNQESLLSFEGVFVVAKGDRAYESNIYIDLKPEVVIAQDFKLDKYHTIDARENTPGGKNLSDQSGFLSMRYVPRELEFHKTHFYEHAIKDNVAIVGFDTKICINDTVDTSRARSRSVSVTSWAPTGQKGKTTLIKTDSIDGCLKVSSQIEYKLYGCHRYIDGQIVLNSEELGMKDLVVPVLINPWAHEDDRMLGRDGRPNFTNSKWATESYCDKTDTINNGTALILQQYRTDTHHDSHRYKVDNSLNLTLNKYSNATLQLREVNYTDMKLGFYNNHNVVRDAPYVLRLALLRSANRASNGKPETVFFKDYLMTANAGDLRGFIDIDYDDLTAFSERFILLTEVYPTRKSRLAINSNRQLVPKAGLSISDTIDWESGARRMTFLTSMLGNRDDVSPRMVNMTADDFKTYLPPNSIADASPILQIPGNRENQPIEVYASSSTRSIIETVAQTFPSLVPKHRITIQKAVDSTQKYAQILGFKYLNINDPSSVRLRKILGLRAGTHVFDHNYGRQLHAQMNLPPLPTNSPFGDLFYRSSPFGLSCLQDISQAGCDFKNVPEVSPQDAMARLERPSRDPNLGSKLCQYWYQDLLFYKFQNKTLKKFPNREVLLSQCMESIRLHGLDSYFKIERVLRVLKVKETAVDTKSAHSEEGSLSIGTNYSLQENFSDGYGSNVGLSVGTKFFELFGAGFNGSYGLSWTRSEQVGAGNNASLSTNTGMKIQRISLPIPIERFQRCIRVQFNPHVFFKDDLSQIFNRRSGVLADESNYSRDVLESNRRSIGSKSTTYNEAKALAAANDLLMFKRMGILVCDENIQDYSKDPFIGYEMYAKIWQDLNNDGIFDKGFKENLKYNFSLRGREDFENFIIFSKSKISVDNQSLEGFRTAFPSQFFPGVDTSFEKSEKILEFAHATIPGFLVLPTTSR